MPTGDEIQTYLTGAWRLMTGKPDGLRMLDLSADGFWNSFFAIPLAIPALVVGWVTIASDLAALGDGAPARLPTVLALALVDMAVWVGPLVVLALAARPIGIADRLVHYVVASNWASVIMVWMLLPPALMRLVAPGLAELSSILSLALFVITLVLAWRMTNTAIGRGPGVATAVFALVLAASFAILLSLQALFGLTDQVPAV